MREVGSRKLFKKIRVITACLCDDWNGTTENEQRCREKKGESMETSP